MVFKTGCITSSYNLNQWDDGQIPELMRDIPKRVLAEERPAAFCSWSTGSGRRISTLNAAVCTAICAFAFPDCAELSLVKIGSNQYGAERTEKNGDTTVVVCTSKGGIRAAVVKNNGRFGPLPALPDSDADLAPLYAAYLALITDTDLLADTEVAEEARQAAEAIAAAPDMTGLTDQVHLLNDIMVTGFDKGLIPCKITDGSTDLLTSDQVRLNYSKGRVICGKPRILASGEAEGGRKGMCIGEARRLFEAFSMSRVWSAEERRLIPCLDDGFPVPEETVEIARLYVESRSNPGIRRKMNNFLWRGSTGYGKSTGVEALACILNTPLLRFTCSSNLEAQDFLSQFVPDENSCTFGGAPSFRLVRTNFVTALEKGYLLEIQEMSRIRDPGVLVTLNEYDRPGALIPLADGSFVKRHPDALVVATDNTGYASCRTLDPAVLRRMDAVFDSFELPDEQLIRRIRYNTGFDDMPRLESMIRIWHAVRDYCSENEITQGDIGVTELERWVSVYMIDGPEGFVSGCRRCVVSKASPDRAEQEEIWLRCAEPLLDTV